MSAQDLTATLRGRLIVSCQAPPGDPMRDTATLVRLARSAVAGGGAAIRANEPAVVAAISAAVDLPVIGLWKDGDTGVYITPTVRHALAVAEAGAAVVAADATDRPRPDGSTFAELVSAVHTAGALVMADVSTLAEGVTAAAQGRTSSPRPCPAMSRGLPSRPARISIWSHPSRPRSTSRSWRRGASTPPRRPPRHWPAAPTASSSAPPSPRPPL